MESFPLEQLLARPPAQHAPHNNGSDVWVDAYN